MSNKIINIYYMLSYAFNVLNEKRYDKVKTENFKNTSDLFAEILTIGISKQIKQGLMKDYIDINENTSSIHGKINISESINSQCFLKKQLNCTYDEFSINCYLNQIIKSTMQILLKSNVSIKRKKKLKNLLWYFKEVDLIDINQINWKIRFDKNNQNYRMLTGICYLTINGLIQMSRLYEKFILNYYKKEHPEIQTNASQIDWQLDNDENFMLPIMQTDVMLSYLDNILIIDAKYYSKTTNTNWGVDKVDSSNLYQIFTYVKNKQFELDSATVSGMLLYAKIDNQVELDNKYKMSGNIISVNTLDLNIDFKLIKQQLDGIIDEYLIN